MTSVPDDVASALAELRHPSRLRILLALEGNAQTVAELSRSLGLDYDTVHNSAQRMKQAGLVRVVESGHTRTGLPYTKYGPAYTGWLRLVETLTAILAEPVP